MFELTRVFIFTIALLGTVVAPPRVRFSFFQPSTPESVERMIELADLRADDVIVDFDLPEAAIGKPRWRAARKVASEDYAPIGVTCPDG